MFSEFKDQVVLVTGAAGGIGSAVVKEFEKYQAMVYKTDIKPGDGTNYIQGDLRNNDFIHQLVGQVWQEKGRIDILINSAGICSRTPLSEITPEEWNDVMDINLTSLFFLTQAVMDIMKKQKSGVIVNLSSIAGKNGGTTVGAHYSASKAAIECFTKTLAKTGAPYGIRANAVAPGIIDTDMQMGVTKEQMDHFHRTIPMKRLGSSSEVAGMILVLASGMASYVTGTNIDIDGGLNI